MDFINKLRLGISDLSDRFEDEFTKKRNQVAANNAQRESRIQAFRNKLQDDYLNFKPKEDNRPRIDMLEKTRAFNNIMNRQPKIQGATLDEQFNNYRSAPRIDFSGIESAFNSFKQKALTKANQGAESFIQFADDLKKSPLGLPARVITGDFGKENTLLQTFVTRPIAESVLSVSDKLGGIDTIETEGNPFAEAFFGRDPLKSHFLQAETGGKDFLVNDLGVSENRADQLVPFLAVAGLAADVAPPGIGGGAKGGVKVTSKAIKASKGKKALNFLLNGIDILVKRYNFKPFEAQLVTKDEFAKLAKAETPKEVKAIVNTIRERITDLEGKRFGALPLEFKDNFADWVNNRRAVQLSSYRVKNFFTKLDPDKQVDNLKGIIEFQRGKQDHQVYRALRNYFNKKYQFLQSQGIDLGYRENYLTQLWEGKDKVIKKLERTLTQKGSFTFEAAIESYEAGLKLKLKPKFQSLSDIAGTYEQMTNRLIADRKFFNFLSENRYILPADEAPKHWKRISDNFPTIQVELRNGEKMNMPFKAPSDVVKIINNYLEQPTFKQLEDTARFATSVKNRALSAGIPGTGVNSFGHTIWVKNLLAADNPLSELFTTTKWMIRPNGAKKFLNMNLKDADEFVKAGMTLSTEDWNWSKVAKEIEGNFIKRGIIKAQNKYSSYFGDATFNEFIPALKLRWAQSYKKYLIETGMSEKEAIKATAREANTLLGGLNVEEMGRDKNVQNFLRTVILAPDFLESNIRTGGNVVKGIVNFKDPKLKVYRNIARNLVFSYFALNVLNYVNSGRYMYENENPFELDTGMMTQDGKRIYIKPYGSGVDWLRVPVEILTGLIDVKKNDLGETEVGLNFKEGIRPVANRLSIPAGAGLHLATGRDYLGRPIESASDVSGEVFTGFGIPSQARAVYDLARGKTGATEFVSQLTEAPVRFRRERSQSDLQLARYMKQIGMSDDDINNYFDTVDDRKKASYPEVIRNMIWPISPGREEESRDPLQMALMAEIKKDKDAELAKKIIKESASREEAEKKLEAAGLSWEEASIKIAKSLTVETGNRGNYVMQVLEGLSKTEFEKTSAFLIKNSILTDAVIDKWLKDGTITEEQAKAFKEWIDLVKDSGKTKKSSGGSRSSSAGFPTNFNIDTIKSTSYDAPSIRSNLPKLETFDLPRQGLMIAEPEKLKLEEFEAPKFMRI